MARGDHAEGALEHRAGGERNRPAFADGAPVGVNVHSILCRRFPAPPALSQLRLTAGPVWLRSLLKRTRRSQHRFTGGLFSGTSSNEFFSGRTDARGAPSGQDSSAGPVRLRSLLKRNSARRAHFAGGTFGGTSRRNFFEEEQSFSGRGPLRQRPVEIQSLSGLRGLLRCLLRGGFPGRCLRAPGRRGAGATPRGNCSVAAGESPGRAAGRPRREPSSRRCPRGSSPSRQAAATCLPRAVDLPPRLCRRWRSHRGPSRSAIGFECGLRLRQRLAQ